MQQKVEDEVLNLFGLRSYEEMEITHDHIVKFDELAEAISSERRSGEEAFSSLSRVATDKDTRKDGLRTLLENREFRLENGKITIGETSSIVGIKRGKPGQINIKSYMPPKTHIDFIHKIFNMIGW